MTIGVMDLLVRWIVLSIFFFLATVPFRTKITVEGASGYLLVLCLLVPLNVCLGGYAGTLPGNIGDTAPALMVVILVLNIILLLCLSRVLPALTISSNQALILFAIVVTAASYAMHHMPLMPDMPISEIII